MALQVTTSTGISPAFQTYFSKKLLDHAVQLLVMDQFAQKSDFPRNSGATAMKFFRPDAADASVVQTLNQGVPISTFSETTWTPVTFTLAQYGEARKISDILNYTDLLSTLKQGVMTMGENAALHFDGQIRNAVIAGVDSGNKHYSGTATTFNELNALSAANGAFTLLDLLWALTKLSKERAPYARGQSYVALIPPEIMYNLMQDAKFVDSSKYGNQTGLFKGEMGMWYNVRCILHTNPWTEAGTDDTEGTFGTGSGTVFSTIITGSNAYGVPALAGMSPYDPRIIINDKADKSDPLNQFITAGWKAAYAAGVLNSKWFVVNRSQSTFA